MIGKSNFLVLVGGALTDADFMMDVSFGTGFFYDKSWCKIRCRWMIQVPGSTD